MPIFGDRVKALRKARGITQREMAISLGISERNYQRYEALESPSNENLIKLADFFQVSTDYLLGRANYWIDAEGNIKTLASADSLNFDTDKLKEQLGKE